MKVKLDENLPADTRSLVASYDHDVDTVVEEGLAGRTDDEVTSAAVREGRIIITLDRGMGDIRRYPPGSHPGIIVFRTPDQQPAVVLETLSTFLANHDLGVLAGCVVVVRGHLVRVRRSE